MTTEFDAEIFKQQVMEEVNKALSGLAARVERETEKKFNQLQESSKPTQSPNPELLALKQQLEDLQKENQLEKQRVAKAEKEGFLATIISKHKPTTPTLLKTVLEANYGEKLQKDDSGNWYLVDGETSQPFDKVVDEFLKGEGAIFLPPTTKNNGTGTQAGNSTPTLKTPEVNLGNLIESKLKGNN